MENNQLQKNEPSGLQAQSESYGIVEVLNQKKLVNELLKKTMIENTHFGAIPGCGEKKALLKPGAETIGFTFRLAPEYSINRIDLPNGHVELEVVCTLKNIVTGQTWGSGVGSCSSMENKYRYQTKNTGRSVPEEFWKSRDKELLGGPQYSYKKVGGNFTIFETIETENPADKFNTIRKIAKKRSFIDAILTATAASDIFTQDIELDEDAEQGTLPTDSEGSQERPESNPPSNQGSRKQNAPEADSGAKQAKPEANAEGDWREVVIGWGNLRGTKLGDVPKNKLWFFSEKWEPRRGADGKITNLDDARMKAAAQAGFKETEQAEKEQAAERGEDQIPM